MHSRSNLFITTGIMMQHSQQCRKTPTPLHHASALPLPAKYQSEVSHNVSDVRTGRAGCLDFQKVAFAGHGLSVLLTAEVDGKSRTYVSQQALLICLSIILEFYATYSLFTPCLLRS